MILYLLTVQRGNSFYVIAENVFVAQQSLEELLDKADWCFNDDRKVVNIKLIANEISHFPGDKPVFGKLPCDLIITKYNNE